MQIIYTAILASFVTSIITTRIMATHYFEIVDSHVKDMTDRTKEFVEETKHRLEQTQPRG